jgi:hypothetical protein
MTPRRLFLQSTAAAAAAGLDRAPDQQASGRPAQRQRSFRDSAVRVTCRVPARRPGNFHLSGQMKVTKAKALNATPLMRSARCGAPAQRATWTPNCPSCLSRTRRRGPRKASPALIRWTPGQSEARPRRARCRFDYRRCLQVARRTGRARREERAEWFCIQALCFGDFHLSQQMKVTRLPGRDPASNGYNRITASAMDKRPPGQCH